MFPPASCQRGATLTVSAIALEMKIGFFAARWSHGRAALVFSPIIPAAKLHQRERGWHKLFA
jgi:hypothetical protein